MKQHYSWLVLGIATILASAVCAATEPVHRYYFANGDLPQGHIRVEPSTGYSEAQGYGWLGQSRTHFAVQLPEGNYSVTLIYETPEIAASTTVKAEARRVMLTAEPSATGVVRTLTVNIRRPEIADGGRVALNARESEPTMIGHWDDLLSLEFLPGSAGLRSIEITPETDAVTLFIAGDSTVADQRFEPYAGWGQLLPSLFGPGLAVANHAESGRALFSFLREKRLKKILSIIKPGDYLLIQFGHNDQKDKRDGAGPLTTYTQELEQYVTSVRARQAIPVLVTPMERRRWNGGHPGETLTDYAKAVREVGKKLGVPVIDLHAMSLRFYAAMGEAASTRAFVFYPAGTFPGQDRALKDNTHHNAYGAYELARCVAEGIRKNIPALARHLRPQVGEFSPSEPDDPALVQIPTSVNVLSEKPEGS